MMRKVSLDFGKPNSVQQRALDLFREGKRMVLISTARQVGKSHFGARWIVSKVFNNKAKNKLGIVIAPTFRQARVAIRKVKEVLQTDPAFAKLVQYRSQPIPTFFFPNGWTIEVHSSHDPDSLRGLTLDCIWFDEIALGSKESFDVVTPTLLSTGGEFLGTTTPRGRQNWLYRTMWLKGAPPGHPDHDSHLYNPTYGIVQGSIEENAENLDAAAIDHLRDQYGEGSLFARQEVEGEWVSFEGLVYAWNEHICYWSPKEMPDIKDCQMVVGGLDFGWVDPAAAVVLGYKEGNWYAYDGFYESKMPMNELAEHLTHLTHTYGVSTWYADSARPDNIADLRGRGLPVQPVVKPKIEDRIKEMAMFTDTHRFKVSQRLPELRDEFGMYQYPNEEKLMQDKNRNPIDANNHLLDACLVAGTLVATEGGEKPIEEIREGERVWTREGLQEVLCTGLTQRNAQIYEITLTDGRILRGTGNHPVFVTEKQRFVSIEELSTGDTPMLLNTPPQFISVQALPPKHKDATTSTGTYIETMWGRFLTGIRFITKTTTRLITTPRILRSSPQTSICPTTKSISQMNSLSGSVGTWTRFGTLLRNGTPAPRGLSGTGNTAGMFGRVESFTKKLATNAVTPIELGILEPIDSVLTLVKRLIGELRAWMTRSASVNGAGSLSPSTGTARLGAVPSRVAGVRPLSERSDVYNLTVAHTPEYFANGILVHNCGYATFSVRWLWRNNPGSQIGKKQKPPKDEDDPVTVALRKKGVGKSDSPSGLYGQ
jgi:hypothetical protein